MYSYPIIAITTIVVGIGFALWAYHSNRNPSRWFAIGAVINLAVMFILNYRNHRKQRG